MSFRIISAVSVLALLAGCSTTQESPIYQQSTKYKVHSPATTSYADYSGAATSTAQASGTYNTTSGAPITYVHQASSPAYTQPATRVNHECLNKEGDRKLIGTGLGGVVGGVAGHELIGGTKGTVIGAVVGGAAGYGIADKTIDCDPIPVATTSYTAPATPIYASTPSAPIATTDYDAGYQAGYQAASTEPKAQYTTPEVSPVQTPSATLDNQAAVTGPAPTDSAYGDTYGTPGYHAMQANGEIETETASTDIAIPDTDPTIVINPTYPQMAESTYPPATPQVTSPAPHTTSEGFTTHKVVEGNTVYSLSRELCVGVEDIRTLNSLDGNFSIKLDDHIKLPKSRC